MSKEFTKSYAINRIAELNEQIVEMTDNQNQTMRYLNRIRDENNQLKQQLAEKNIRIEELEGQFAYECECNKQLVELQKQLEEKGQEKEVSFGTQLAIAELEKVKDTLTHFCNIQSEYYGVKAEIKGLELYVCGSIDYQIRKLKGE